MGCREEQRDGFWEMQMSVRGNCEEMQRVKVQKCGKRGPQKVNRGGSAGQKPRTLMATKKVHMGEKKEACSGEHTLNSLSKTREKRETKIRLAGKLGLKKRGELSEKKEKTMGVKKTNII